jgi:phosphoesterase RecJ-like protein
MKGEGSSPFVHLNQKYFMYSKNFTLLKDLLVSHNSFLITSHINPDADALGSEIALYFILKKLGKQAFVVNHSETPYNLQFLDEENIIQRYDEQEADKYFNSEVLIVLDLNHPNRTKSMEKKINDFKGIKICIDHHQNPAEFFNYIFGGTEYSSTGEIIYELIEKTSLVEVDQKIAFQIYAAIMTDTGSFRFERTSSRIHNIIAELLDKGVNPTQVYDQIFNRFKFGRIKLLGKALTSVTIDETGKIAWMVINQNDLIETQTEEADVEGFVNFCLTIDGVQIAILLYELNDGVKISFRSKGSIPVNKLAESFNGGGHFNASGARLFDVEIHKLIEKVIKEAKKYLIS